MNLDCPHCGQNLEMDEAWRGNTLECPNCHQSFTVPAVAADYSSRRSSSKADARRDPSSVPDETTRRRPPMHVPLQPIASTVSLKKARKGPGCGTFLLLLIVLAAGGFGYAMYRWKESPQRTWQRLTILAQRLIEQEPAPAPAPAPSGEQTPPPTAAATPKKDPLMWLIQHKKHWPKGVDL